MEKNTSKGNYIEPKELEIWKDHINHSIETVTKKVDKLMSSINVLIAQNKEKTEYTEDILHMLKQIMEQEEDIYHELLNSKKEIIKKEEDYQVSLTRASQLRTSSRPNTDISRQLFDIAGKDTAQYVEKNLPKCRTFSTAEELREFAVSQVKIEGLYLEFGVYSGKTINQVADLRPEKTIYGFDSFEGLPETWRSGFYKNRFATDTLPVVRSNVSLIKGWFDQTLSGFLNEHPEVCAYLHVDCDLYSSTKTVLHELQDRIVSGTVIIFDEYFNYPSWREHEFKAFQEFVTLNNISYEYIGYVPTWEQVVVKIL